MRTTLFLVGGLALWALCVATSKLLGGSRPLAPTGATIVFAVIWFGVAALMPPGSPGRLRRELDSGCCANAGGMMSTTDRLQYFPTTGDIRAVFVEEIASLGGTVPDVYDDGERLFARAVLPADTEILPGDRVRGGVAVRVTGPDLLVHPYTFRQVCSNGAIAAQAIDTRRLERTESTGVLVPTYEGGVTLTDFRLAVQACASQEAFTTVTNEMRSATLLEADMALHLMPILGRMPGNMASEWVPQIFHRFVVAGDRSVFGLMNATTSLARDTRDPETRWRLEDLGGSIVARLTPRPTVGPAFVGA